MMKLLPDKLRRKMHRPRVPAANKPNHRIWWWTTITLVVGLGLLFWSTSARMVGEPITLNYGPSNPVFMDSMGPLLGAEFTSGNRIKLLSNGDEFFPAMLKAISK